MGLRSRSFQDGRFSSNFNWSSWARIWQGLDEGGKLGALLDLLQLLLGLPELGQVEGGDLLSLLDLLLVDLDLGLQLGGQVGHPVLVLLVLASSECELLALALSTLVSLGGLSSASLGASKLGLQLVDLVLQLGHGGLATLGGGVLGIGETSLELSRLVVQGLLGGSLGRGVVLLGAELVSKRAASTIAFLDFSSAFLAAPSMASTSAWMVWMAPSRPRLAVMSRPLMTCMLLTAVRPSAISISSCLLERSELSIRALDSSNSPERGAALRSEMPTCSMI